MNPIKLLLLLQIFISCDFLESDILTIPFETLSIGVNGSIPDSENMVINDTIIFKNVWQNNFSGLSNPPQIPPIDFTKNSVIAVFAGQRNSGGYSIVIDAVVEKGNKVVVIVDYSTPEKDDIVTLALTYPFHIIKIPATTKNVFFTFSANH